VDAVDVHLDCYFRAILVNYSMLASTHKNQIVRK
jgi:hypothetical protein